jgi:DNA-binding FadR family transcriptional regulator
VASGRLPAGRVLTLEGVGAQYQVSRSVAREAIRVLEVDGHGRLLPTGPESRSSQPPNGVFDPRLIRWRLDSADRQAQLASLSELRRGFEPAAAALAARRAGPHQCRIMAAAVSDMGGSYRVRRSRFISVGRHRSFTANARSQR